jgi:hypothetical protein
MDLTDSQDSPGKLEMMKTEMMKKTLQIGLTNFMDSSSKLTLLTFAPPTTSDSLPLSFPHISTLAQATDLSEEDTPALDTTDTDIDDYTLTPRSAQAKVNDSHLLKVFQWLQDLR